LPPVGHHPALGIDVENLIDDGGIPIDPAGILPTAGLPTAGILATPGLANAGLANAGIPSTARLAAAAAASRKKH